MLLRLKNKSLVRLIGDPHFGRQFVNGVPLHRRGEREQLQKVTFQTLLNHLYAEDGTKARTCICVGDLFDQFEVDASVVFTVYTLLVEAAYNHPDVDFVILQGNHDVTRNTEAKSSFELLECMLSHMENVLFVRKVEYLMTRDGGETIMFVPYDAFTSAKDLVTAEAQVLRGHEISAAVGHWDIEQFSENTHNLVPIEELKQLTKLVITGHVHSHQVKDLGDEASLLVTGSMLPYSHGEDHSGQYYVTVTLKEYYDAIEKDSGVFHDKSLRVLLADGEEPPLDVDAFQFTYKKVNDKTDAADLEVKMEIFSFKTLYTECMEANGVPKEIQEHYWSRYEVLNASRA